jgi:ATP-dependent helicase/nuclease subunit B
MTRFDGLLSASDGLPDYAVDDISIAPTTLEKYAECPHGFFVRRLLGVEPLEQPEDSVTVSAAEIGTLVHDVMDRLVSGTANLPAAGAPWTPEHRRQLEAIVVESMDLFEQQGLSGHPRLWAGERLRIARDIERMLDADDEWRREGAKTVVASEMPFGIKGEPPVSIPVPGGRVLMRGSADKVDVGSDGTVWVTDIKTGSSRTFKPIKTEPFVGGTKLQLPVYAAAARERFGSPGSPVLAGYWFVRRDPGRLDIPVDDDLAAQYGEVIGTLVRSIAAGLFPPKAPDEPDFRWTQCPYCNPDGLGHGEVRERYERKRTDPVLADLVELIDPAAVTP